MNIIQKIHIILFLSLTNWLAPTLFAQEKVDSLDLINQRLRTINLPPLDSILDSAYIHSPIIHAQSLLVDKQKIMIALERKMWLKAISLNSNYNWGNNSTSIDGNIGRSVSTTATQWYGIGASVSLPLSVILNRRGEIQIAKIDYEIAKDNIIDIKQTLKKIVTELYIDTNLKEKILALRANGLQTLEINYHLAKLEFKDNIIDIATFSKIHETYITSQISFERAKRDYAVSISMLESAVGIKLR